MSCALLIPKGHQCAATVVTVGGPRVFIATTVFLAAEASSAKLLMRRWQKRAFALAVLATVGVVALLWWMRKGRSKEGNLNLSCRELPVPCSRRHDSGRRR